MSLPADDSDSGTSSLPPPGSPEEAKLLDPVREALQRLEADRQRSSSATDPASEEEPPPTDDVRVLGRFRLLREIGRGGFGIVFQAYDPTLKREVALKVPRPEALLSTEMRQRFLREAQVAAGLDHPNIVPVHEIGAVGEICFIVSAYCRGPTLLAWQKQKQHLVEPDAAAELVAAVADAADHAHRHGVLHRDIKPANILIEQAAAPVGTPAALVPRLTDFGMAKLVEQDEDTRTGVLLGTPSYMAPEQAEGRSSDVGPATDVYGLGCVLYELLTERPPFKGATALETLEQVRSQPPLPPSRLHPRLPRDLETICLKCLDKEPGRRYPSAAELALDLRRFLQREPIQARPPSLLRRAAFWGSQLERARDAGILMMAFGTIFAGFCALIIVVNLRGVLQAAFPVYLTWYGVALIIFVYLPMIGLGWKILTQRLWAAWVGFLTLLACTLLVLVGSIYPYDASGINSDPNMAVVFNMLITAFASVLTLSNGLAAWAISRSQRLKLQKRGS